MGTHFDRRGFLLGGLGSWAALTRSAGARSLLGSSPGPVRSLVLIQLSGGNDGLSTLVPYSDDAYAAARQATRHAAGDVLRLDERVGLHPELGGLRELFDEGRLALFEGVGYPNPNRSHFRSLDIWHAADARGRGMPNGWVGRCAERFDNPVPHSVVHLGPRPPFSLYSAQRAPLCLSPMLLRVTSSEGAPVIEGGVGPESEGAEETLLLVRKLLQDAQASSETLRRALEQPATRVAYPGSSLGQDLRNAAALIHAEVGMRVCSIEFDGFDTHRDQRARHDRLMSQLDAALKAFAADLAQSEAGREAVVLLFSEFGRRVTQNASGGTDHGAAGLALAFGERVRGGLHGRPPSLQSLADGDLAFTTDFRSLYAGCIRHVFDLDPDPILGRAFSAPAFV